MASRNGAFHRKFQNYGARSENKTNGFFKNNLDENGQNQDSDRILKHSNKSLASKETIACRKYISKIN